MILEPFCLKSGQQLSEDYLHQFDLVKDLYAYNPWDNQSQIERAAWLDQQGAPIVERKKLVEALLSFNRRMGNASEAIEQIEALDDPQALVIVGGQQAGLFTGELLVMYKAITILHAAKAAEKSLGRPVIAVFWIAGEDHDFDEVNHINLLNSQQELSKINLHHPDHVRTSISRLQIADWRAAIDQLDTALLDTEFKADIMQRLNQYAETSHTLTELFAQMMAWLFGKQGLVLLDSDDPALGSIEAPMFRRLIEGQDVLSRSYKEGKELVEGLGYVPQADVNEQSANLFIFDNKGERVLLYRRGDEYTDRKGERSYSKKELLTLLDNSPEAFSNNVLTRPLMQEYLFPVLSTVLGPGELAYWALTKPAFEGLQMQMPILLPRKSYTLVEGTIAKHMRKYHLTFDDVLNRFSTVKENWLREQDSLGLESLFAETKNKFRELYEPVVQAVSSVNPGMAKLGNVNMMKILEQMEFLEARSTDAYRAQFDASIRQWDRIALSLVPAGKLQERSYNVLTYLVKYGDTWLRELIANPTENWGAHQLVYFS
ncbi:MAG: bacillithiol biosynthesis cysteine-adding enzyme BshC [Gorillibacterium sp.]|nr:bacillithiol biosynthesis cysteine-adding enzyme BshC [Gorillibacterium sp.]